MRTAISLFGIGLAVVAATQIGAIDLWLSDRAYDFELGRWAIDHGSSAWRPVFYEGPKALIIAFAIVLLTAVARPALLPKLRLGRREATFLLLCLLTVPLVVGLVRDHSSVSCPSDLQRYGGQLEDRFGVVSVTGFIAPTRSGGCWPSGHASGGFALLCLAFLPRTRRIRVQFAALGLAAGSMMGAYQVLRGSHFASHVVVTMLLALLLIVSLRSAILK